jgi:hypothetical protein
VVQRRVKKTGCDYCNAKLSNSATDESVSQSDLSEFS